MISSNLSTDNFDHFIFWPVHCNVYVIRVRCRSDIYWTFSLSCIGIQFFSSPVQSYRYLTDVFIKYLVVFMCDMLFCLRVVIPFVAVLTYLSSIRIESIFILTGLVLFLQASSQNCRNQLLALSFLSVCLSVRASLHAHGTTVLPLEGFSWNLLFEDFSKICRENSSFY